MVWSGARGVDEKRELLSVDENCSSLSAEGAIESEGSSTCFGVDGNACLAVSAAGIFCWCDSGTGELTGGASW